MDYSIYKDDSVLSTVDRIISILDSLGIKLEEYSFNLPTYKNQIHGFSNYPTKCDFLPHSSRVTLFGIDEIGTNGKGTSKENSRASAYSEFMERLQNQSLPDDVLRLASEQFYLAPDEKEYDKSTEKFISKYKYCDILSACTPRHINNVPFKKVGTPYFNIKDNKLYYLPSFRHIFTSNGMTAGNTPEEALVQGFSEICERIAHKEVFLKRIPMPDIPAKYYEKYERIKGLIDYTEQLGWKVQIKDASLGKGLPVVCTIFENPSLGYFSYKFASQPSLPIAIERTLTEFFQGGMKNNEEIKGDLFDLDGYSKTALKNIFTTMNFQRWFFKFHSKFHKSFSKKNPKYKFSASSWVDENRKYTNKELLKFIIDKITNITKNDIFVRDVSFLGFPSYHIFIPKLSEMIIYDDEKLNLVKWLNYEKSCDDSSFNIDSLISAINYRQTHCYKIFRTVAPKFPDEVLLILCYIMKNDYDNIIKSCEALKRVKEPDFVPQYVSTHKDLIDFIYQYYKLKQQNESKTVINNIMNNLYNNNTISGFDNLINDLNFDYIKNIIFIEKEKEKEKEIRFLASEDTNKINKINEVKQKLIEIYKKNTPDQMELAKIFDFSDIK